MLIFNPVTQIVPMDCAGDTEVTSPGTIIVSPNHPHMYDNDQDCKITVKFGEGQRVATTFLEFDIQDEAQCLFDWLEVRDGDSDTSNLIEPRLCGNKKPEPMMSTTNSLTILFHSDLGIKLSGFMIQVDIGEKNL